MQKERKNIMTDNNVTHSDMTESEYLAQYNIANFDRPSLATDIVLLSLLRDKKDADIKSVNAHALQILLIKRASHPCKDKWALPGGFCRPNESVYETAKRELKEETNIQNAELQLSGVFSKQNRDPRGWIISTAWLGLVDRYKYKLRAETDAWEAAWFTIIGLNSKITNSTMSQTEYTHTLTLKNEESGEILIAETKETIILNKDITDSIYTNVTNPFAFDHNEIIIKTLVELREKIKEDIRPVFNLLPTEFTLGEVEAAYEFIIGCPASNFRRKIADYVVQTDKFAEVQGFRPAKLYVRNNARFVNRTYTT